MLSNFIHQIVHHYIWSLEQSDVTGDFKHGSIWRLFWHQDESLDAPLDLTFRYFGVAYQYVAKLFSFSAQEISYFFFRERRQCRHGFGAQRALDFSQSSFQSRELRREQGRNSVAGDGIDNVPCL